MNLPKFFLTAVAICAASAVLAQQNPSQLKANPVGKGGAKGRPAPGQMNPIADKEDLLAYADLLYSQKQYAIAARQYQLFIQQHPKSKNIQAGWFRLGECYLQAGQIDDAEATFNHVVGQYKNGVFVGSAAYRLAVLR
ncbi:MAG: tetratricopeptide repeat protein [Verrucomicrobiales bacterium]|nr:tetratricopeptide repeat protein [Verrucomicrobiales bacterium]